MKKAKPAQWKNRIVGHSMVAPGELMANPRNWRIHPAHQREALAGVLDEIGWVQQVVVNKRNGLMVDGHLRAALALSRNEPDVPVIYVDLAEDEEAIILASLDPLAALAITDEAKLTELLGDVTVANAALDQMLYALLDEANQTALRDADEQADESEDGGSKRNFGSPGKQIKPVLYVEDIAIWERAIRATGEQNRGRAIISICKAYLESTEGQFDFQTEVNAALTSVA